MQRPTVSLIAAVARNGTIGKDNALPWHLPADLRRFKQLTLGHTVLMGRRTWESLPAAVRPLPGRRNIVLTRTAGWQAAGAEVAGSVDGALQLASGDARVFVIGGAQLYASTLPLADELLLTRVDADVDGDSVFPAWDPRQFDEVARGPLEGTAPWASQFVQLRRR